MKKQIIFLITVLSIFTATFANADLLFKDTFDNIPGSGDVNTSNSIAGRQFGTLAPLSYNTLGDPCEVGDASSNPGFLTVPPNGHISPDYDFTTASNIVLEFDMLNMMGFGSNSWTCLAFGKPDITGAHVTDVGMSMLFFGHGHIQTFETNQLIGSIAYNQQRWIHVSVNISTPDFSGTKPAYVTVFVDGKPILIYRSGFGTNDYTFVFKEGFANNRITIFNPFFSPTNTLIDNIKIRSVDYNSQKEWAWTSDADTEISTNKTYTHAVKFNSNGTFVVNGVPFEGVTNTYGSDWTIGSLLGVANFPNPGPNNVPMDGGALLNRFIIANGGYSSYLFLTNLVANGTYKLTLYSSAYGALPREVYTAGSDGSAPAIISQGKYGNGNGHILSYEYVASDFGTFSLALTPLLYGHTWHYYAFSNETVPPKPAENVSATQGEFTNKVVVTWAEMDSADKYLVYRNTTTNSDAATPVSGELVGIVYTDTTVTVNLDYYYWVKTYNTNGWSEFGNFARGFSTDSTGPDTPVNQLPADDAMVDFPVTLEGSSYFDQGTWPMNAYQWQINDTTNFISVKWNSGEIITNAVSIEVPTSVLGLTNYWRVRYKNNRNAWSDWSMPTSFRTERDDNSPFYFYDTFNNISGSGNVNKDYTASGRQYGRIIPVDYSFTGSTEVGGAAVNPNELTLSSSGSACSPNWSFEESTNFMIDVIIKPSTDGSAITFGKFSQNQPANSIGGFGIVFYGDGSGRYDVYSSSTLIGTFTNDIVKASELHVLITASTASFDNDPAYIAMSVNGTPLTLERQWASEMPTTNIYDRWCYLYTYVRVGGFEDNYITLYNYGGDSVFDNLKISTINAKFSTRTWDSDNDTWIGISNSVSEFTHAVNLNHTNDLSNPVIVNSLDFECPGRIILPPDLMFDSNNPEANGTNWNLFGPEGWISAFGGTFDSAPEPSGDGAEIVQRCVYGWSSSLGVILSNLVPNSKNVLNIYGRAFDSSRPRVSYISGSDGGLFEVNENVITTSCQIIEYEYTAGANGTFTFTFTPIQAQDYMFYGFSSYLKDIPEPKIDVVDALDFGEVAVTGSKSMNLDIFNVGGGVVSGTVSFASVDTFFTASTNYYYSTQESPDTINVFFQPDEEIDYSNTLYLTGSGTNGIIEVALTGTGIPEPVGIWIIGNLFLLFLWKNKK